MTTRPGSSKVDKSQDAHRAKAEVQARRNQGESDLLHELRVHQIELEMQNEELRRVQLELEESRDRYIDLYEFAPVGYVTLGSSGHIESANLTLSSMLGFERSALLKLRFSALVSEVSGDDWHRFMAAILNDQEDPHRTTDLRLRRRDEGTIEARLDCLRVTNAVHGAMVRVAITDITRIKQTEIALQASEKRYSLLAASTFEGIAISAKGRIVDVNEQLVEMLGFPRAELIGRPVAELISDEDRDRVMDNIHRGHESHIEHGMVRRDGSRIEVEAHGQPFSDDGRAFRLTALRDITARKEDEAAARIALHMEHLRNLAIEATLSEERERHSIAKDLHDGLGQTLHLARFKLDRLVKALPQELPTATLALELIGLLSEASGEVRSLTSKLSPPALKDLGLVAAISWLADEMGRRRGLQVVVEDDGVPKPLTEGQSTLLFRAVRELVINIAKHAGVGSARIGLRVCNNRLIITVADKGVGFIDWRATLEARRGFGLSSVRERITFLKGVMDIQTRPGEGTTVVLEMPFDYNDSAPTEMLP
ncbi:PAS domain-containing sensor histidine kinase [Paramagnetospirillum magneticum]|uniref:Signal transduction histidine kinase n=1 Tax=Paramagnetospirillum magneticum (strain ATCC 700264 / AMB-1) TaxID=342108 RepID=Q2W106_PARM1|nr:PAS domain S-box protein [Paramagnetospirillum magneticum]BAE52469.1 Signal transduction histidine kinase [Paramagnetospirillum magneticum AMB-1]